MPTKFWKIKAYTSRKFQRVNQEYKNKKFLDKAIILLSPKYVVGTYCDYVR